MHELKSSSHFVIKKFSNTFLCKEEDTERVKMRWALLFAVVQKQKGKRALSFYELLPFRWLLHMKFRLFYQGKTSKMYEFPHSLFDKQLTMKDSKEKGTTKGVSTIFLSFELFSNHLLHFFLKWWKIMIYHFLLCTTITFLNS